MQMECGLSAYSSSSSGTTTTSGLRKEGRSSANSHKDGLHVNFEPEKVEIQERKKKFLTAKYGTHQMSLIKKRLTVEMWVYDQIQNLYSCKDDSEVELDLDELLDIDEDNGRRNWLMGKLKNAKSPREEVIKFIEELLKRAETL